MKMRPTLTRFNNGDSVTLSNWHLRKQEIYSAIIPHEYGTIPPPGKKQLLFNDVNTCQRNGLTSHTPFTI